MKASLTEPRPKASTSSTKRGLLASALQLAPFVALALAVILSGCAHHQTASSRPSTTSPLATPATTPSTAPFSASPAPSTKAPASTIVFTRRDGHIWTVDADGSHLRQLTGGSAQDSNPVWAPGRKEIAFVRKTEMGEQSAIVLVRFGDGVARTLYREAVSHGRSNEITSLAYTAKGRQLAFADSHYLPNGSGASVLFQVIILDLKTRKTEIILRRKSIFGLGWGLSWSPNGKTLLVSEGGQDENNFAYVFDVKSRKLRWLGVPDAAEANWSPDGKSILVSTSTMSSSSILLVNPGGTVLRTLATGGGGSGSKKAWVGDANFSGNGRMIVYARGADGGPRLWLMRADGSGKRVLTQGNGPVWR